jgi:hypothetical protein
MRLTLIQVASFVSDWKHLRLTDEDLCALETILLERPTAGKIVPGTGGLRKIRFAPPSWNRGKRGAVRVCYAYFLVASAVYLLTAYAKNEQEDITPDRRRRYRRWLAAIEQTL